MPPRSRHYRGFDSHSLVVFTKNHVAVPVEEVLQTFQWPISLLVSGIPFGAAGQNIILGIVTLAMLFAARRQRQAGADIGERPPHHGAVILTPAVLLGFLLWTSLSSFFNHLNPHADLLAHWAGYAPLVLLPAFAGVCYSMLGPEAWRRHERWLVAVVALVAALALSQAVFGWERLGMAFVSGSQRARALYSHPLTLAYAVIFVLPWAIIKIMREPRRPFSVLFFLSVMILVWTTRSRVVQCVSLALIVGNIFYLLRAKARWWIGALTVVFLALVAVTNNPVSRNFRLTFSGEADRHAHGYADDRLAFWHAHWLLIKERPILGHGFHIPAAVKNAAYEQLGLAAMPKKYNAHNIYIQIAAESGSVGLAIFLLWVVIYGVAFFRLSRHDLTGMILLQTWLAFWLASLTQNALHDNEVRYCLICFLGFAHARLARRLP